MICQHITIPEIAGELFIFRDVQPRGFSLWECQPIGNVNRWRKSPTFINIIYSTTSNKTSKEF